MKVDPETKALLASFNLEDKGKGEVWDAFLENPEGLIRAAKEARSIGDRNGNAAAGLLISMVRRGDHKAKHDPKRRRITGWRWVRGTHSATYLPDPHGTDPLPEGYGLD